MLVVMSNSGGSKLGTDLIVTLFLCESKKSMLEKPVSHNSTRCAQLLTSCFVRQKPSLKTGPEGPCPSSRTEGSDLFFGGRFQDLKMGTIKKRVRSGFSCNTVGLFFGDFWLLPQFVMI